MTQSASNSIYDFLKRAVVVGKVHLHLLDAGLAVVVGVSLGVQQDGNHLVGETVFGEAADAHVPLAQLGIKFEETLREAVIDQIGKADEVGPVVVREVETH